MNTNINEFFAVTKTSVYHVEAHGEWHATGTKIAQKGKSKVAIGYDIADGGMIAIGKCLQGFIPERYGFASPMTGFERQIEMVNTQWWRGGTSSIVALFKNKRTAMACLNRSGDKKPCDSRWIRSTREIIAEIGDEHPSFSVCHHQEMRLLPTK